MKKISVIIPVYNVEEFLRRCIDSLVLQSYKNLEIILVDDGSTDASSLICDEYKIIDSRVKVIHRVNEGVSSARNYGIKVASGEYVTFVDSDDWLEFDAIETMSKLLEKQSVDFIRLAYYENYPDNSEKPMRLRSLRPGKYDGKELQNLLNNFIVGNEQCYVWLLLVKKELLKTIGGFNTSIHMMEDSVFYVNLLTHAKSIYLSNDTKYHYFQNISGATKSSDHYQRNIESIIKVNADIKTILEDKHIFNESFENNMDTIHVIHMTDYLVRMHRGGSKLDEIYQLFTKLHNNESYRYFADNLNLEKMPIHVRLTIDAVYKNHFWRMMMILETRRMMKIVRKLAFGEKNENS